MATGHTFGTKFSDFNFYLEAPFGLKKPVFLRFFALGACGGYPPHADNGQNRQKVVFFASESSPGLLKVPGNLFALPKN